MSCPWAGLRSLRALLALALASIAFTLAAAAQPPADPAEQLDRIRLALDRVEAALKREGLPVQALYDLGQTLNPLRQELRGAIAGLEPRLAQVDAGLKQLGPAPAKDAPAESEAIATERIRLNAEFGQLDAALKQARLLASRADELAERITDRRRAAYAKQLFEQSPSALSPFIWIDAARALPAEVENLGQLLRTWLRSQSDRNGLVRVAVAALTLVALGIALIWALRRWQRHFPAPETEPTRFAKAFTSLRVLLRIALTAPLTTLAVIVVLESFQLLPAGIVTIAYGIGVAVAIAALGRGVAEGVLAVDASWRRFVPVDDATAAVHTRHYVWAARALGALVLALIVHRVLGAQPVVVVATNMLFAALIAALLLHLLLVSGGARTAEEAAPRGLWLRAIAWVVLAVIAVALVTGYAGFAGFLAERLISTVAVLGTLLLLLMLSQSLLLERLAADTPRGRAIAANLGLTPRRLDLLASLVSGSVSLLLVLSALILVVGPWEVSVSDFLDTLRKFAFGFRVGELNISFSAIFSAAFLLVVTLIVTRVLQSWLERSVLPRTDLDPGLQNSIAAIFGYVGAIVAIVLALSHLGIDLQKVALIAGALSVGIGFGLQSIVSNFVSGLILLAERPIRVGDLVVVKGEEGYVRRIRVRATEIETFERASVIIPNAEFISGPVKNWTHANTTGRIVVKVGVAYDSDADRVRDILIACADEQPRILKYPPPRALLLGFGESALEFELRAYVEHVDAAIGTRSDLHLAILRQCRAAGISIPFPQREVRLVKENPPARDRDESA